MGGQPPIPPAGGRSPRSGINVRRNYVGEYCTSLDMADASITLSRLDDEITGLLAAPGVNRQASSARPMAKAASRSWRE